MSVVKVSWSGGKDSTASFILNLAEGYDVTAVCYIPLFTESIPLISKEHYDFLLSSADVFRSRGASVIFVHGDTYVDHCSRLLSSGNNIGLPFGFPAPIAGSCDFSKVKIKALSIDIPFDWVDIGIASDEYARLARLKPPFRSILADKGLTEEDARLLCRDQGLLSPRYLTGSRDGCVLCPNGKRDERIRWFKDYPEAFSILLDLQDYFLSFQYRTSKGLITRYPLRGHTCFIDRVDTLFGPDFSYN